MVHRLTVVFRFRPATIPSATTGSSTHAHRVLTWSTPRPGVSGEAGRTEKAVARGPVIQETVFSSLSQLNHSGSAPKLSRSVERNDDAAPRPVPKCAAAQSIMRSSVVASHRCHSALPEAVCGNGNVPHWGSGTIPPSGIAVMAPGAVAYEAALVNVPVFIGMGERDLCSQPLAEPLAYECASDVTVFVCQGMAHMHNFAKTRKMLWARVESWGSGIGAAAAGVARQ